MLDTNSIVATTQNVVQMAPVLTKYQQHWPVITVAGMWLVREAHVWWPFLVNSGGITGICKLLWNGKQTPPADPAKPQTP